MARSRNREISDDHTIDNQSMPKAPKSHDFGNKGNRPMGVNLASTDYTHAANWTGGSLVCPDSWILRHRRRFERWL